MGVARAEPAPRPARRTVADTKGRFKGYEMRDARYEIPRPVGVEGMEGVESVESVRGVRGVEGVESVER